MAEKRVTDVSTDYGAEPAAPASDHRIAQIKKDAAPLKTGKLERDVDAVLRAKGLRLDEPLGGRRAGRRLR